MQTISLVSYDFHDCLCLFHDFPMIFLWICYDFPRDWLFWNVFGGIPLSACILMTCENRPASCRLLEMCVIWKSYENHKKIVRKCIAKCPASLGIFWNIQQITWLALRGLGLWNILELPKCHVNKKSNRKPTKSMLCLYVRLRPFMCHSCTRPCRSTPTCFVGILLRLRFKGLALQESNSLGNPQRVWRSNPKPPIDFQRGPIDSILKKKWQTKPDWTSIINLIAWIICMVTLWK